MLGPADARDDQMQVTNPLGIDLGERPGQEIGLFLIVADPITTRNQRFKGRHDFFRRKKGAAHLPLDGRKTTPLLVAAGCPGRCHVCEEVVDRSIIKPTSQLRR
jgi:hypothetical protein